MKYLLITIISIVALAGCGGAEERKAAYLEKAKQSLKIDDVDKARIELKNVLQIDPKHPEAHFQLGKIFEGKNEFRKAFAKYKKASELDPDNAEYLAKLGNFHLILAGDIEKATEYMQQILSKNSEDTNGLLLKAGVLLKQGKGDEAENISKGIYDKDPDNVENIVFLSARHKQNNNLTEAIGLLDEAYKNNPNSYNLAIILAQVLYENKDYDKVEDLYKSFLDKRPDLFNNYLNLVKLYRSLDKNDKAEKLLKEALQAKPGDSERQITYVAFIQQTKGNQEAISVLNDLIKQYPKNGNLRLSLGQLYLVEGKYENAVDLYKKVIDDFSEEEVGVKSRLVLASIDLKNQDITSAEAFVDEALEVSPNDASVNFLKAKISLIKKDSQQAIISLRTVIKDEPQNIEAYFLLAQSHILNNEKDQADDVIQRAYDNNRTDLKSLLALSQYHLKNKNNIQAEKIIDNCLAIDENNYEALTVKAGILTNAKKHGDAKQYVDRLLEVHPNQENGYFYSASTLLANNEQVKAIALLEEGYIKTNYSKKILMTLTKMQVSTKEYDKAINRINNALNKTGGDADLYMALSGIYMSSGNYEEYEKNLKQVIQIKPDSNKIYILLSKLYVSKGQNDKAMQILNNGLAQIKDDYALSLSLAGLFELNKEYDSAIDIYEGILKINANQIVAINNLAALLVDHRTDSISLNRAKELADKIKDTDQPALLDTVGWVHYKSGNYTGAVSTLEMVVKKAPDNSIFNYHLGMAYFKVNEKESAKTYLSKALVGDSDFTGRREAEELLKTL